MATTASDILVAAYRESNLTGVGRALTSAQETEGLTILNGLLPATVGQEIGQELSDLNIGGEYEDYFWEYVPQNVRLVLNIGSPRTLKLHPRPYNGQRLAVADAGETLGTSSLTLDGNGRLIEGDPTIILDESGMVREWIYRADLGQWLRLDSLELTSDMPFPREFDDYWSILLAMRLNPRHGRELAQSSATWLQSMASRLEARYRRPRDQQDWGSLGLLGQRRNDGNAYWGRWGGW